MDTGPRPYGHGPRPSAAFARSDDARPAWSGFGGAALITVGGLGAGSTQLHDPLLEAVHLSWVRLARAGGVLGAALVRGRAMLGSLALAVE